MKEGEGEEEEEEEKERDEENSSDVFDSATTVGSVGGREGALGRKRLESTSLQSHPVKDDNLEDFHEHRLAGAAHPLDVKYNLYSMVVSISFFFF